MTNKTLTKRDRAPLSATPAIAYKVRVAAQMLGVNRDTVYALVATGRLRHTRLPGGTILISRKALDEFLAG